MPFIIIKLRGSREEDDVVFWPLWHSSWTLARPQMWSWGHNLVKNSNNESTIIRTLGGMLTYLHAIILYILYLLIMHTQQGIHLIWSFAFFYSCRIWFGIWILSWCSSCSAAIRCSCAVSMQSQKRQTSVFGTVSHFVSLKGLLRLGVYKKHIYCSSL